MEEHYADILLIPDAKVSHSSCSTFSICIHLNVDSEYTRELGKTPSHAQYPEALMMLMSLLCVCVCVSAGPALLW